MGAGLLLLAGIYSAWNAMPEMPVREVSFKGTLRRTTLDDLAHLAHSAGGSLWRVDLEALRTNAKRLPWIRDAAVRRVFPDRIEVALEEHTPVAYWKLKDGLGLVNSHGEVFRAEFREPLPTWSGPRDSAGEVMQKYARFSEILTPSGAWPVEVRLSERRAWQLKLDDGTGLELGRADTEARLERFTKARSRSPNLQLAGLHADLRYGSGLALRKPIEIAPSNIDKATRK
jgi:cell division protein FtsQ